MEKIPTTNEESPVHNPDNLSDEQIGVDFGWRLLKKDELNNIAFLCKNDETLEEWFGNQWELVSDLHHQQNITYRTKKFR